MLDGMEELTLEVSHLISFIWFRCKGCSKDFPVSEYTYVACFKVAMWFVFALCGLMVFMVYDATTYSEPFQISKMEFFVKIITSNEITSLLRHWKGFWIRLCWMQSKLLGQVFAPYFMFQTTCVFCHFSAVWPLFQSLGI